MTAVRQGASASRDWLAGLAGEALDLLDQVGTADHVVTVSTAGESAEHAAIIAEACNARRITLTALVIDPATRGEARLRRTASRVTRC